MNERQTGPESRQTIVEGIQTRFCETKDNSAKYGEKVRCMTCRLRRARGDQEREVSKWQKFLQGTSHK